MIFIKKFQNLDIFFILFFITFNFLMLLRPQKP